jgi:hypothetical protein
MRTGITVHLSPIDRKRLSAIVYDRNSPQKQVWRARIVLAMADGLGTVAIMREAGVSKTAPCLIWLGSRQSHYTWKIANGSRHVRSRPGVQTMRL